MNTTIYKFFFFLVIAGILISSCEDNEPAPPKLEFGFIAQAANINLNGTNTSGNSAEEGAFTYNEALMGMTELELEMDDDSGNGDDDEVEFEGEYTVNLLTGTTEPALGPSAIKPGVYEELEMEIEPVLTNGHSFFIRATFIKNGEEVPVIFTTSKSFELEIEDDDGFLIQDGLNTILLTIDLDNLFNGIDLYSAETDEDGTIRISENFNPSIYTILEQRLETAFEANDDDDDDDD